MISPHAESAAVGILSSDGRILTVTSSHASYHLNISQDSMTGTADARSHEPNKEHEHFGAGTVELTAVR